MVFLTSLTLTDFRNYAYARLELDDRPVVLVGSNGAGKTNLLEAVSFLTPGRGMRRAKIAEVGRQGAVPWVISAHINTLHGEIQIGTGREALPISPPQAGGMKGGDNDKRLVRINGAPTRSANALAEYVSAVWLTPENDKLFLEGQSARRRFLDRLVYGFDPGHAERVSAYEYAMRERNRLLSHSGFSAGRADPQWLDTLERKLAETATAIGAARLDAATHLNQSMEVSPRSFPKAALTLSGFAEDRLAAGEKAILIEEALAAALHNTRAHDAQSGRTSLGAHRSELTVMHCMKHMEAAFCSTGEQKALLLSIVLAEARVSTAWRKRAPLLLLDEVAAHLDSIRRAELFEEIQAIGVQAWMTGTDRYLFEEMHGKACIFQVENGVVSTNIN